jgi:phosphatidylcholine synthase
MPSPPSSCCGAAATCPVAPSAETDHFFLGFPSYWNIVAFYVIVFDLGTWAVGAMLLLCSLLVFVPVRYVYPSRTLAFRKLTITLTSLWLLSYVVILVQMPNPDPILKNLSLLYLVYYFGLSFYISWRMLKDHHEQGAMN